MTYKPNRKSPKSPNWATIIVFGSAFVGALITVVYGILQILK